MSPGSSLLRDRCEMAFFLFGFIFHLPKIDSRLLGVNYIEKQIAAG